MTEEALSWIITMLEVVAILVASGVVGTIIGHLIHFGAGEDNEQDIRTFSSGNRSNRDDLL
jgi:hypothetical protein